MRRWSLDLQALVAVSLAALVGVVAGMLLPACADAPPAEPLPQPEAPAVVVPSLELDPVEPDPVERAPVVDFEPVARPEPPAPEPPAPEPPHPPPHVATALSYVGTTERTGRNDGPEVEAFLRSVGLGPGPPWCAAFTTFCLKAHGLTVTDGRGGTLMGAGATRHLQSPRAVDAREVQRGVVRPEPGWLVVWRRGSGWQGHIGFFVEDDNEAERGVDWYGRCGWTVEGNTSSGRSGSQRDGDGVWRRLRCLEPGSYFRVVGFVPPEG